MVDSEPCQFGEFKIYPNTNTIVRDGVSQHLAPLVMDLLMYLIVNHDRTVPSNELLDKLWPGRIVEESTVHRHINQVRAALGDSARRPIYIRTVSKRGYQAIAPVILKLSEPPVSNPVEPEPDTEVDEPDIAEKVPVSGSRVPTAWPLQILHSSTGLIALVIAGALISVFLLRWPGMENSSDREVKLESLETVAVLPFKNLSDEISIRFFSRGVVQIVLDRLANSPSMKVASGTETSVWVDQGYSVGALAKQLEVSYLVDGSVQFIEGRVRVAAQLVRAIDGFHVWSRTYDREFTEGLLMQKEIGEAIANSVRSSVWLDVEREHPELFEKYSGINQAAIGYFIDGQEQYDLYLRGEGGDVLYSLELLKKAADIDPGFAAAQDQLAWNCAHRIDAGQSLEEATACAHAAISKSLAINPDSSNALFYLAQVYIRLDLDYSGAQETIAQGMKFSPEGAWWRTFLSDIAFREGRVEDALRLIEMDSAIDHGSERARYIGDLAWAVLGLDQPERALQLSDELLMIVEGGEARAEGLLLQATALIELGERTEAMARMEEAWSMGGASRPEAFVAAFASLGQAERAKQILSTAQVSARNHGYFVRGYLALGDHDSAFELIRSGIEERDPSLLRVIRWGSEFDVIEDDARFAELLALLASKETHTPAFLKSIDTDTLVPN